MWLLEVTSSRRTAPSGLDSDGCYQHDIGFHGLGAAHRGACTNEGESFGNLILETIVKHIAS